MYISLFSSILIVCGQLWTVWTGFYNLNLHFNIFSCSFADHWSSKFVLQQKTGINGPGFHLVIVN